MQTLFAPRGSILKVVGPAPMDGSRVEITIDQTPLIDNMWRVSRNFLTLSLTVSAAVVFVLWLALWQLVIRPVRRLTSSIIAFGEKPQDASGIVAPSGRDDEIGRAEAALAQMQGSLAHELSQRKRLAELGMAVARINHDLRNMLAAAQLISDRLATISDPLAQRLAPQLVATLDRAIQFCQSTLTYGAAREQAPTRRRFDLREIVRQVVETAEATGAGAILYAIDIPPNFELFADPDHVRRVIENLSRNAAQALQSQGSCGERPPAIRFAAIRTSGGMALIEISDSGPGFSPDQSAKIFEPFHLSTREGGSGLGLAIAADLIARNGGSITLAPAQVDDFYCGARFLITLPTPRIRAGPFARRSAPDMTPCRAGRRPARALPPPARTSHDRPRCVPLALRRAACVVRLGGVQPAGRDRQMAGRRIAGARGAVRPIFGDRRAFGADRAARGLPGDGRTPERDRHHGALGVDPRRLARLLPRLALAATGRTRDLLFRRAAVRGRDVGAAPARICRASDAGSSRR